MEPRDSSETNCSKGPLVLLDCLNFFGFWHFLCEEQWIDKIYFRTHELTVNGSLKVKN